MSVQTRRYMIKFSYIGTSYRGSQKHVKNNVVDQDSVQGALDSSLWRLWPHFKTTPTTVFAGRTDSGVHALGAVAHIDLETDGPGLDTDHVLRHMNRFFIHNGHDIRVHSFYEVYADRFHARFSAQKRTYLYRFLLAKESNCCKVPILEMYRTAHVPSQDFDIERVRQGAKLFEGLWDFQSFSHRSNDRRIEFKNYVRRMEQVSLEETTALMPIDPLSEHFRYYHVIFKSKSFVYNQIRRIMGALFSLGAGKITEKDIITMLKVPCHKNYFRCQPADPHGLYLKHIEYNERDIQEVHPDDS